MDEKSLRKMPRARWNSGYTCITGVLWKIGQGDQISPGGRQMMRSVIKYWVGGGVLVTWIMEVVKGKRDKDRGRLGGREKERAREGTNEYA